MTSRGPRYFGLTTAQINIVFIALCFAVFTTALYFGHGLVHDARDNSSGSLDNVSEAADNFRHEISGGSSDDR